MSDEWNTAPAPTPIFGESDYTAFVETGDAKPLIYNMLVAGGVDPNNIDKDAFFPAPEPPPPIPVPAQPVSAALVPAGPMPVVTTDPWHAPWVGPCSPEMATAIEELLAAGVEFEGPQDADGAKYPLLQLAPMQSLVWQCANMAEARVLHNRVNVFINRITKRTGRHFKVMKHNYGPDMVALEVTRII